MAQTTKKHLNWWIYSQYFSTVCVEILKNILWNYAPWCHQVLTVSPDFQIRHKFEKIFGSQTWLKLLRNIQIDNIQPRFFNCVWKVGISKSKSSMITTLRAKCWFLWFSNFFWSSKQKFLIQSHFLCCSNVSGSPKLFGQD